MRNTYVRFAWTVDHKRISGKCVTRWALEMRLPFNVAACDRGNGWHYNNSWNVQQGDLVGASSRGSVRLYLKSDNTVQASGHVYLWSGNLSLILLLPLSYTPEQFMFMFLYFIYVIVIIIIISWITTHYIFTLLQNTSLNILSIWFKLHKLSFVTRYFTFSIIFKKKNYEYKSFWSFCFLFWEFSWYNSIKYVNTYIIRIH